MAFAPRDCTACGFPPGYHARVVPGEGGLRPLAFFVGEAPGPQEDAEGRPFVGRAGQILRRTLAAAGWGAEELWITNAVKCFPYEEVAGRRRIRKPTVREMEACLPFLASEVQALEPKLLVALGATAAAAVLGEPVKQLATTRGRILPSRNELGERPVLVTYHPSGLHYRKGALAEFESDLRAARKRVEEARGG